MLSDPVPLFLFPMTGSTRFDAMHIQILNHAGLLPITLSLIVSPSLHPDLEPWRPVAYNTVINSVTVPPSGS